MRNRFDQLGKELGLAALAPVGKRDRTTAQYALNAETLFADLRHEPEPGCAAARAELGLLGRLAASDCLIELFSQAPGLEELHACLTKRFLYWQERARAARAAGTGRHAAAPQLWIFSAGVPRTLMADPAMMPAPGWPAGVYRRGGEPERVGLVVTSELPVTLDTLLVRLMAGGPPSTRAAREVLALPRDEPVRRLAGPVVLHFKSDLDQAARQGRIDEHEREFHMAIQRTLEDIEDRALELGRGQGRAEGRTEERRAVLRTLLGLKFGALSPEADARIAEASPSELERFIERVLFADSPAAVLA